MGKIKTEGRVTLEFDPELYEIEITISAEGKTSGAAVTAGKQQTEQLLQSLQDELGIKPEQISDEYEEVSEHSYRQDNTEYYGYIRHLRLIIPADNTIREAITDLLVNMNAVVYHITPYLTDENNQKQIALDAAVQCARQKAEQIANSLNCQITGFEEINIDNADSSERFNCLAYGGASASKSLAADLQNPKIKITGEVTVVWLTEPLT